MPAYLALCALVIVFVGRDLGLEIFPRVDAGRFQLRMRAPTGTRIEETEKLALQVLGTIRDEVGADGVEISLGYVGLIPSSYPINAIYQWTGGPEEVRAADRPQGGPDHDRRSAEGAASRHALPADAGGPVLVRAG